MAFGSAWGRWFSAQHLVNNGTPIGHRYLIHTAARIVMDKILDGDLAVRGRRPGRLEYEDIARTDWRSSAFYVVDDPISLWRLVICPRGVVEIEPDGTVHASDSIAAQRTAQLDYDSFIVDGYQFEKLWPKTNAFADKKRRKLLREARRRRLDKDEIQRNTAALITSGPSLCLWRLCEIRKSLPRTVAFDLPVTQADVFNDRVGDHVAFNVRERTQLFPNLPAECEPHVAAQFLCDGRSPFEGEQKSIRLKRQQ